MIARSSTPDRERSARASIVTHARSRFWDGPTNGCWKCPTNFGLRTVYPVDGRFACGFTSSQTCPNAYASSALFSNPSYSKNNAFFDPRDTGGQCWVCENNMFRTSASVADANACEVNKCSDKYPSISNQFKDPRNGGECWSCGTDTRTMHAVNDAKACSFNCQDKFGSNAFFDFREWG
jgi:hypothetical protein